MAACTCVMADLAIGAGALAVVEVGVHVAAGRQPRPQHLVHGQGGEAGPVAEPRPLPLLPAVEPLNNCYINTFGKPAPRLSFIMQQ